MSLPSLPALQQGDANAWDEAFDWLWPVAFAVAQLKLQPYFPNEAEDVAIEALEELVPKVREVKTVEEFRPLAASIAHHRAVSLLRKKFAQKGEGGKTEPLDPDADQEDSRQEPASNETPLARIEQRELAQCISQSLRELKPPQGEVLSDFVVEQDIGTALNQAKQYIREQAGR